jgi:hypothetical protein
MQITAEERDEATWPFDLALSRISPMERRTRVNRMHRSFTSYVFDKETKEQRKMGVN